MGKKWLLRGIALGMIISFATGEMFYLILPVAEPVDDLCYDISWTLDEYESCVADFCQSC